MKSRQLSSLHDNIFYFANSRSAGGSHGSTDPTGKKEKQEGRKDG
jgi:hypothetical protein